MNQKITKINLNTELSEKLSGAQSVFVLGMGAELRSDDGAGVFIAKTLIKKLESGKLKSNIPLYVSNGSTAPENCTDEVKKFKPSHLIIVDAALMGLSPGEIKFVDFNEIEGITFNTHTLPVKIIIQYILKYINCKVIVIGIQPKTLDFASDMSEEMQNASELLIENLCSYFGFRE